MLVRVLVGGLREPRDFVRNAARAVKDGLPPDAAVRALTINAAKIAGAADRLGSLEKGKIANVIVTDGDLFDDAHAASGTSSSTAGRSRSRTRLPAAGAFRPVTFRESGSSLPNGGRPADCLKVHMRAALRLARRPAARRPRVPPRRGRRGPTTSASSSTAAATATRTTSSGRSRSSITCATAGRRRAHPRHDAAHRRRGHRIHHEVHRARAVRGRRADADVTTSPQTATDDERRDRDRRDAEARAWFATCRNRRSGTRLKVTFDEDKNAAAKTDPKKDPWNLWVFRTNFGGSFEGEESNNEPVAPRVRCRPTARPTRGRSASRRAARYSRERVRPRRGRDLHVGLAQLRHERPRGEEPDAALVGSGSSASVVGSTYQQLRHAAARRAGHRVQLLPVLGIDAADR